MTTWHFAAAPSPEVSVVLVSYGGCEWTHKALSALTAHTPPVYELIVVDNPAGHGSAEMLRREVVGATLLCNAVNIGFGAACNQGAAHARGRYLAFLNNDVLVHPGWLPPLLEALARDPAVAAVGPRFLNLDGSLQEAGALLSRSGEPLDYGDHDDPERLEFRFARSVDYVAGACLLVHRRAFCAVGGFDTAFGLAYYEDADLCLALAQAGFRTLYEPRSVVTHVRGGSGASGRLQSLALRNRARFEERWRSQLASRPLPPLGANPRRQVAARDAPAEARLLVLSADPPLRGSPVTALVEKLRQDRPWATITLVVADGGAGSDLDAELGLGVEVAAGAASWPTWFLNRRFHYDEIFGSIPSLDGLVDRTQPQAVRH